MLRYEHIEYLNLLFGIPVLVIVIILYNKWRRRALELFGDNQLVEKLTKSFSTKRSQVKDIITILIFTLIIIGMANPQIGTKMEEVKREGVDLMILLDLSNSMMAEDIIPNRLEMAKLAIEELIDELEGDRIGLIVFAGEAYVQLPITTDYSAAKLFLATVDTSIMPTQGTEIATAINLSIESFNLENGQNKAIIILTDGETHDDDAVASAREANKLGIFVHTVGMGLSEAIPIPALNNQGKRDGYRVDKQTGKYVLTKLNEEILLEIANAGKGTYIRAKKSEADLSSLLDEINAMEKKEIGTMVITEYKDRFQLFIGLASFLLFIDLILLRRKNTWLSRIKLYKKL